MEFNSLKALYKHIQKQIDLALEDDVAKHIKDEIQKSVVKNVYAKYDPIVYERRGEDGMSKALSPDAMDNTGSLGDREKMISNVKNGALTVENIATFNENYDDDYDSIDRNMSLAHNIEYGYGEKNTNYKKPRPFMSQSVKEIKKSESHIGALKKGLKKRGFKFEKESSE